MRACSIMQEGARQPHCGWPGRLAPCPAVVLEQRRQGSRQMRQVAAEAVRDLTDHRVEGGLRRAKPLVAWGWRGRGGASTQATAPCASRRCRRRCTSLSGRAGGEHASRGRQPGWRAAPTSPHRHCHQQMTLRPRCQGRGGLKRPGQAPELRHAPRASGHRGRGRRGSYTRLRYAREMREGRCKGIKQRCRRQSRTRRR